MTVKKAARKGGPTRLKVKKETLKDLDVKRKAGKVKGGTPIVVYGTGCNLCYSVSCPPANLR